MRKHGIKILTAVRLAKLLIAGSRWVSKYADILNDLNVYPVPDGDTGTNMSMTLQAVENDLMKLNKEMTMEGLIETVTESVLLGARGNSGTILSQYIQGFLNSAIGKTDLDIRDVVTALGMAKEAAYNSVTEPVEGTILTVMRKVHEEAEKWPEDKDEFIEFLKYIKNVAHETVEQTIDMLPKLKEAGVVDAGAKGLYYFLEGFEVSVTDIEMSNDLERIVSNQAKRKNKVEYIIEDIEHKYCTEFIILSGDFSLDEYKEQINSLGDSIIAAQTSKKTKTHIHTNNPGIVLEIAGKYGELMNIKIDNMAVQHRSIVIGENEKTFSMDPHFLVEEKNVVSETAFVVVADTVEMAKLFIKEGAAGVILGGQSKNPSVSDFEEIISQLNCNKYYILPNNKNIISTAEIVRGRAEESGEKTVTLIETKTMLEGHYILKNKKEDIDTVIRDSHRNFSIEITKAVRDSKNNGLKIKQGDYLGIVNGKLKYNEEKLEDLIGDIYREKVTKNTLRVFAVKGKETTKEGNDMLLSPEMEMEIYEGQQDNYSYYIYIENRDPDLPEVAIVTDSAGDVPLSTLTDHGVNLLPIIVNFDNESYRDVYDITPEEFWHRNVTNGEMSKTAHPSTAEMKDMYERLFAKGYKKIIALHMSSKMSGLQQSARLAKSMVGREKDIEIVDSKAVTLMQGHLVLEAAKMAKSGESFEDIIKWLEKVREKGKAYFVVNDLRYLEKGGRIGKAAVLLGGALKLKPVMKIENGEVCLDSKVFGESAAIKKMEKAIKEEAKQNSVVIYPIWGGTNTEYKNSDKIRAGVEKNSKVEYKGKYQVGPVVGTHSGAIYGVVIYPKIN